MSCHVPRPVKATLAWQAAPEAAYRVPMAPAAPQAAYPMLHMAPAAPEAACRPWLRLSPEATARAACILKWLQGSGVGHGEI